jgi:hypothetical protein
MKHKIARYMCVTGDKNESLARDKLLIIPVVAGTLQSNELQFEPTDYTIFFLPLPSFTPAMVFKLLQKEGVPAVLLEHGELRRLWYLMGLVPRNLEDAYTLAIHCFNKPE